MFLTNTININLGQAGVYGLLGYGVVFFGLILLMIVVTIFGKIFSVKQKKPAAAPVAAPAAPAAADSAIIASAPSSLTRSATAFVTSHLVTPPVQRSLGTATKLGLTRTLYPGLMISASPPQSSIAL